MCEDLLDSLEHAQLLVTLAASAVEARRDQDIPRRSDVTLNACDVEDFADNTTDDDRAGAFL